MNNVGDIDGDGQQRFSVSDPLDSTNGVRNAVLEYLVLVTKVSKLDHHPDWWNHLDWGGYSWRGVDWGLVTTWVLFGQFKSRKGSGCICTSKFG